jgi:hypothetical protein
LSEASVLRTTRRLDLAPFEATDFLIACGLRRHGASHNLVDMSTARDAMLVQSVSHPDIGTIVDQRRRLALRAFLTIRSWVAQADGTPLQPDTLTQDWLRKLADMSLPRIRFSCPGWKLMRPSALTRRCRLQ